MSYRLIEWLRFDHLNATYCRTSAHFVQRTQRFFKAGRPPDDFVDSTAFLLSAGNPTRSFRARYFFACWLHVATPPRSLGCFSPIFKQLRGHSVFSSRAARGWRKTRNMVALKCRLCRAQVSKEHRRWILVEAPRLTRPLADGRRVLPEDWVSRVAVSPFLTQVLIYTGMVFTRVSDRSKCPSARELHIYIRCRNRYIRTITKCIAKFTLL